LDRIRLVKATWQDRDLLFEWTNEEAVRKNSIHTQKVEYQEHIDWFSNKLKANKCDIYIYYVDNNPVGQIRLDYKEEYGWISFSIDHSYRGQGHGTTILKLAEEEVKRSRPTILWMAGVVKKDNIASQKKFEELNYVVVENNQDTSLIYYQKSL
jgi:RimJ/RimL family protein N-acetyltransferase